MSRVIPDSRSLILRSTHIIRFQIASSEPAPWVQDGGGSPRRRVSISARVEEVLKGEVAEKPGDIVRLEPIQTRRSGTRIYAVPGAWSEKPVDPGTQLVAFCSSASRSSAQLLLDPDCKWLFLPEECLLDVRLAMRAESEKLGVARLLDVARPEAASLHFLFAEYLGCELRIAEPDGIGDFRLAMSFLKIPQLDSLTRATLLSWVSGRARLAGPAALPYGAVLVATMFDLLAMPEASGVHDSIVGTELPNLLGLEGRASPRTVQQVWGSDHQAVARAQRILNDYHGTESAERLRKWLDERP